MSEFQLTLTLGDCLQILSMVGCAAALYARLVRVEVLVGRHDEQLSRLERRSASPGATG